MSSNAHLKYRPDIDGLRTIAVSAVVLYHAFPTFLTGGYVGVDLFFVISGYLISSLILKELHGFPSGNEQYSFVRFYARRTRRIFPALAVVLLATLITGWFVLLADEYKELGQETIAGAAFIENLFLWREAGYFDSAADLKPLLHLWSLGVEEQFYLGWPVLLFVAHRLRWKISLTIVAVAIASFILNIVSVHQDPTAAFYSPLTRIWQFMGGATMALLQLRRSMGVTRWDHWLAWTNSNANLSSFLGLALIIAACVFFDKSISFPGWWALLPTLGAYLLISAGPHAWLNQRLLSSKLFVSLGLISYPIYLWHWPILFYVRTLFGENAPAATKLAAIALTLLFSYLTYFLIEKRVRFRKHKAITPALISSLVLISAVAFNIFDRDGLQFRLKGSELQRVKFNATLSYQDRCRKDFPFAASSFCLRGSEETEPSIALIGDSHAQSLYQGLVALYAGRGENLVNFGAGGGIPLYGVERVAGEGISNYGAIFEPAFDYVLKSPYIKTVILMNKAISPDRTVEPLNYRYAKDENDPIAIYGAALSDTAKRVLAAHKELVIVIDNPLMDFDPATCVPRPSSVTAVRQPCAIPRAKYEAEAGPYRKKVEEVARRYPSVKIWDMAKLLCDEQFCWAMKDGKMLYNRDGTHLSVLGSRWLAEHFSPE